jgi:hypothetical protein
VEFEAGRGVLMNAVIEVEVLQQKVARAIGRGSS